MPEPESTGAELAGDPTASREGTDVAETGAFGTEEINSEQPLGDGSSTGSILDRLGVPEEIAKQIGLGQKAEAQPPAEGEAQPEGEAEPEPEAEGEPEPEPEAELDLEGKSDETRPNKTWAPEVQAEFNKRVGKLTKQRETEKGRADSAEAERDQLKEQLAAAQPVQIQPTEQNPLAGIETPAALAQVERECDFAIDWADRNKDGCLGKNPDGSEYEITPEKVAEIRRNANRALRALPKREKWMEQRAEADQVARAVSPRVFEKNSVEYQVAQAIMKEIPGVADHPARNLILTDYMTGLGMRLAKEEEQREKASNGNGAAAPAAQKKTANSPNPLTRKIPPVAQHVARTSSAPVRSASKQVDDAMNNVVASQGDRTAIALAFRAITNAEKTSGSKRAPAPV